MLTYGTLRKQPSRFAELGGLDALVAASTLQEELIERPRPPEGGPSATMVFMHETIALMKAERAAQLIHLKKVIGADSLVIPIARKKTSFWDNVTVGRASTADIVIEDPAVSSMHAEFLLNFDDMPVSIQDVGSSNGTYVNREPLQPHQIRGLTTGDCVRVGQTIFYFISNGALEELIAK